ncbi:hypothetical protein ACFLUG_03070 [Chloroflexota bacterium]
MFGSFFIPFEDRTGIDHTSLGKGLSRAIKRYQHGLGLDRPVNEWFPHSVPATTIESTKIETILSSTERQLN